MSSNGRCRTKLPPSGSRGQKTLISEGRYITERDGLSIYSFTADAELRFLDDTR